MARLGEKMEKWLRKGIRFYRYCMSPFLGQVCRFHPSCSLYAEEAIERFGLGRGGWLALQRVCKCHPWHSGGVDEVPKS